MDKACGNCANNDNGTCEEYGYYHCGVPVCCDPPYDEACELWTDDPKKANTWRRYV